MTESPGDATKVKKPLKTLVHLGPQAGFKLQVWSHKASKLALPTVFESSASGVLYYKL